MKIFSPILSILLLISCASGKEKEKTYTGSTPAGVVARTFLGIPLTDSVDFIRWELFLRDGQYHLHYNYGIGKPNTNGFINDGIKMELSGELSKDKNYYRLSNAGKFLQVAELNGDLLQLLDEERKMLVGNGGWSYTLNNTGPALSDEVSIKAMKTPLNDSMVFDGRTPCGVPGVIAPGTECYKLKWRIVLYAKTSRDEPGTYKILGTALRKEGGQAGDWQVISGKDGRIIYQLNDENGKGFIYLLKLDEQVLVFTTAEGKLLVGNQDFSYTMNRVR